MAATLAAQRLTEAHRLAQANLGARIVEQMIAAWRLLDPNDLDSTTRRWLSVAVRLVMAQNVASSTLALDYLRTFRALELGTLEGFDARPAPPVDETKVATSLTVTGPVAIKIGVGQGIARQTATAQALAGMAREAQRHTLAGGRDTITAVVQNDPKAIGYARSTSGSPCAFCAMLAARGAAYKSEGTADFEAHKGCNCEPEPVYRRDADLPTGNQRYADLWKDAKSLAKSEDIDTQIAFRRLVEGRA